MRWGSGGAVDDVVEGREVMLECRSSCCGARQPGPGPLPDVALSDGDVVDGFQLAGLFTERGVADFDRVTQAAELDFVDATEDRDDAEPDRSRRAREDDSRL